MRTFLATAWGNILRWLERGNLVPLLVLVSAAHYAYVLQSHDWWPIAIAIGLLVDIGHFRSVLIAVRYTGARRAELAMRYAVACVMTAISLSYHWRFYDGDWTLAVPMPLLIAALAYFERRDARQRTTSTQKTSTKSDRGLEYERLRCPRCGATSGKDGKPFRKVQQVSAHLRWCGGEGNGNKRAAKKM